MARHPEQDYLMLIPQVEVTSFSGNNILLQTFRLDTVSVSLQSSRDAQKLALFQMVGMNVRVLCKPPS